MSIGLPEGYRPGEFAFAPYGNVLAYCASSDTDMQNGHPHVQLIVRDLEVGGNILQTDLGYPAGCLTGENAFNEDGTKFTLGIVNYFVGEESADTTQPEWRLLVYDMNSLTVAQEINASTNPIPVDDPVLSQFSMMPQVRYFAHDISVFRQLPWGVGGMEPQADAYMWDIVGGSVEPIEHYGAQTIAVLPDRGELFWLEHDESLALAEPFGEGLMNNVVRTVGRDKSVKTIYYTPDWLIIDMVVINDGRQLALLLSTQDSNSGVINRWLALDRSGTTQVLGESDQWSTIRRAPNGFTLFSTQITDPNDPTTRSFALNYVTAGTPSELWSSPQGDQYWEFVWAHPWLTADDITGPFTPVQP